MAVWLLDPSPEGETTGPPDDALAADLAKKLPTKAKGGKPGKEKDHQVQKTQVTSIESTTEPPTP